MTGAPRLAQVVLAAGRSRRMGAPKPLVELAGATFLERVLCAARDAGVERSVVVLGEEAEAMRARHRNVAPGLRVLWTSNPDIEGGPLASLKAGLRVLEEDPPAAFLLHPVDCPLAEAGDIERLRAAFLSAGDPERRVFYLSARRRRGHPVLCPWGAAAVILSLPRGATARAALSRFEPAYVITPNEGVLEDLDTPDDVARAEARLRSGGDR